MRTLEQMIDMVRFILPLIQRRYSILELGVFGSYVHGHQHKDSDLDLLVDFGEGVTLIDYVDLQFQLSQAIGIDIDLANKKMLKRGIGKNILNDVIEIKEMEKMHCLPLKTDVTK